MKWTFSDSVLMTLSKLLRDFCIAFFYPISIYSTFKNNLLPPLRSGTFTIALLPKSGKQKSFCKLDRVDLVSSLYSTLK